MSETLDTAKIDKMTSHESSESLNAYNRGLDAVAVEIPEVAEDLEVIRSAGGVLIEEFGINPELFNDSAKTIIFASLASRFSKLSETGGKTGDTEEKEFIADAIMLLARNNMSAFPEVRAQLDDEDNPTGLSEEAELKLYDKYTSAEMSAQLVAALESGLLEDVKNKLGIADGNEDEFEVRVLSFASASDAQYIRAPRFDDPDADYGDPEVQARRKDSEENVELEKAWTSELIKRREAFMEAIGKDFSGTAWITRVGGKRLFCINMASAEILLNEVVTAGDKNYTQDDAIRNIAVVAHEYTHTQGGVTTDEGLDFGLAAEERRAEFFSGDKHGYMDVKHFFQDLKISTGFDIREHFATRVKGGSQAELSKAIIEAVSLDRLAEVLMVLPDPYGKEQSNSIRASAQKYLGGISGTSDRLFDDAVERDGIEVVSKRADNLAEVVARIHYQDSPDDVEYYRSQRRGGTKATDLIIENAVRIGEKKAS